MKHTFGKRLGALGLCLCLMLCLLPGTALAADPPAGVTVTISTYTYICANGNPITIEAAPSDPTKTIIKLNGTAVTLDGLTGDATNGYDLSECYIIGGAYNADVASTSINMTGGKVYEIYGGGYADGTVSARVTGNTAVIVGGSAVVENRIFGGGLPKSTVKVTVEGNATITIQGNADVGDINGGGNASYKSNADSDASVKGSATITVQGNATVRYIQGGGYNSHFPASVGGATVNITGGSVYCVNGAGSGGMSNGTALHVNISGGSVEKVNDEKSSGNNTLAISGSAKVSGSDWSGNTGIDLGFPFKTVTISSDFSGSVCFQIPNSYDASGKPTVATYPGADLTKLSLGGLGATGKLLYLDGDDVKIHLHDSNTLVSTSAKAATCAAAGNNAYWTCSLCGKVYSDETATTETTVAAQTLPTLDHTPGDPATCTTAQTCTECGTELAAIKGHDFTGAYLKGADGHWHKCKNCDVTDAKAAHVWDGEADTECNTCGYTRTVHIHEIDGEQIIFQPAPLNTFSEQPYMREEGYYYLQDNAQFVVTDLEDPTPFTLCLNGHSVTGSDDASTMSIYGPATLVDCQNPGGSIGFGANQAGVELSLYNDQRSYLDVTRYKGDGFPVWVYLEEDCVDGELVIKGSDDLEKYSVSFKDAGEGTGRKKYKLLPKDGNIVLAAYKIAQQPSKENGYTATPSFPDEVTSYQWHKFSVAAVDSSIVASGSENYDALTNVWSAVPSEMIPVCEYFSLRLQAGAELILTPDDSYGPDSSSFMLIGEGEGNYATANTVGTDGKLRLVIPAGGTCTLAYDSSGPAPTIQVECRQLGDMVEGQTTDTLDAATAPGTYACKVVWGNGMEAISDPVTITAPPHSHGVDGDSAVDFTPWTATDALPTKPGHYYLTENVTLNSRWYGVQEGDDRTIDLCLNGKTVTFTGAEGYAQINAGSRLNICDCGEGGTITSDATEHATLFILGGTVALYGGTIEKAATYSAAEFHSHAVDVLAFCDADGTVITGGAFYLAGGTVKADGVPLYVRNYTAAYLSGAPELTVTAGDFPQIRIEGYGGSFGKLYASGAGGAAYTGEALSVMDYSETVTEGTVVVHGVNDGNAGKFTLKNEGFFMTRTGDDLIAHPYAITQQPDAENDNTVDTNHPDDAAYQWYTVSESVRTLVEGTAGDGEVAATSVTRGSYADDVWSSSGSNLLILKYPVQVGDVVTIKPTEAVTFTKFLDQGEQCNFTYDEDAKAYVSAVATADKSALWGGKCYFEADAPFSVIITITHTDLTAVDGQDTATLTATAEGDYLCKVSWPDGNALTSDPVTVKHTHALEKTEAVAATCTTAGNSAYWTCSRCHKVYADEDATTETTVAEMTTAALGHDLTKTEAVAATCTTAGNNAYWTCSGCDKVYSDEEATTETTVAEMTIAALGHDLTKTEAKTATCTEGGNSAYWTCSRCNKVYSDEEATTETTVEAMTTSAKGHTEVTDEAVPATCTEPGKTAGKHCSVCDAVLVAQETVDALGHDWDVWSFLTEPTLTTTGSAQHICTRDESHKETEVVPVLTDPIWTLGAKTEPTEDKDGAQVYTSKYGPVTVILPATGHTHTWGAWTITAAPTETEIGAAERVCTKNEAHKDAVTLPVLTDTTVWAKGARVEPTDLAPGKQAYISQYGTVTVEFPIPAYGISGTANEPDGEGTKPVPGATIILMRGTTEVARTVTDENGHYSFENVTIGSYNVVAEATKDGVTKTMTQLVTLTHQSEEADLTMPTTNVNSVLKITTDDAPTDTVAKVDRIVVGGLEKEAEANKPESAEAASTTVTVTMTVESRAEAQVEKAPEIKAQAGTGATLEYLEIKVEKKVETTGEETQTSPITTTQDLLTIIIPFDFAGKDKDSVKVYRFHGDKVDVLDAKENADKEYMELGADAIILHVKNFSTYAVGYTEAQEEPVSPARPSSRPSSTVRVPEKVDPACPKDETCPIAKFADAKADAWYHDGVHDCLEKGLMVGTSDTTFEPETPTSRAMIAAILWRLQGSKVVNYALQYDDVAEGAWYTEAVRWATSEGIVNGYGNGSFGPDDPITREQLAAMLYRYEQKYGNGGFTGMWMFLLDFADADQVSEWADEAMHWMTMKEVITGKDNKVLDPAGTATRAEAAAMLERFLDK